MRTNTYLNLNSHVLENQTRTRLFIVFLKIAYEHLNQLAFEFYQNQDHLWRWLDANPLQMILDIKENDVLKHLELIRWLQKLFNQKFGSSMGLTSLQSLSE